MRELELKKHGLKVHLRDPSSYTPIRCLLLLVVVVSLVMSLDYDHILNHESLHYANGLSIEIFPLSPKGRT